MKTIRGWACVGSHGHIYATEFSPHEACIGRFQLYLSKADAQRNDSNVVEVEIREVKSKKVNKEQRPNGISTS